MTQRTVVGHTRLDLGWRQWQRNLFDNKFINRIPPVPTTEIDRVPATFHRRDKAPRFLEESATASAMIRLVDKPSCGL
jgi:hypothetical protein